MRASVSNSAEMRSHNHKLYSLCVFIPSINSSFVFLSSLWLSRVNRNLSCARLRSGFFSKPCSSKLSEGIFPARSSNWVKNYNRLQWLKPSRQRLSIRGKQIGRILGVKLNAVTNPHWSLNTQDYRIDWKLLERITINKPHLKSKLSNEHALCFISKSSTLFWTII